MKCLYLDCVGGISGDMLIGALIDLGLDLKALRRELAKLALDEFEISAARGVRQGISGTKFDVAVHKHDHHHHHHEHDHHGRSFNDIQRLIESSKLSAEVKRRAIGAFRRLAVAEGKIHGVAPEKVHFHEVGAVDSIVDFVGACIGLRALGVERVVASAPLRTGFGFVDCAHGRFPVPAPATVELLKGVPTFAGDEEAELITPTGAALLREFAAEFGPMPPMAVRAVGYGLGSRNLPKSPNVLRALLGDSAVGDGRESDRVAVLETNLDDVSAQVLGDVMDKALAAGALDVFHTPIQMKKNRPGVLLSVLCAPADADRLSRLLLENTTAFGVRRTDAQRLKLDREIVVVKTAFGRIEVKVGRLGGRIVSASPEFESCKSAAAKAKVPVRRVLTAALAEAEKLYD
ncbi:MAG: nickel pincer cofactor biosynthesis protein LarC [Verrucomicrobia bacterium]|nr:nickel pincer cofactor biosynthesis protein LarC [Verrucomicrobiota bacterium]